MKISGVFKFYQNGELVGEAENKLTEIGRILAIKTLSGAIPSFGTSIGVGTGDSENTVNQTTQLAENTRLDFRVSTAPVIATNIDNEVNYDAILFKGRITDELFYKIYEVGLFSDPILSGSTNYKNELILSFENGDNLYNMTDNKYLTDEAYNNANVFFTNIGDGTYDNNFRIGRRAVVLKNNEIIKTNNSFVGLDQYDDLDKLTLAFGVYSGSGAISIKFISSNGTRTYSFSGSATYNVVSKDLGQPDATTGTFNWNEVSEIQIQRTDGTVVLDGLKIENFNILDTNRGMVSRAKLPVPLVKLANIPVDIEYTMRIGFNG